MRTDVALTIGAGVAGFALCAYLVTYAITRHEPVEWQNGDLIFQTATTFPNQMILDATASPLTNVGIVVVTPDGNVQRSRGLDADLPRDAICFVNPGTVGHPRDRDPRAAYALFDCDTRRVSFRRVVYDRAPLLRQNRKVGLVPPSNLRRVAARVLGFPRP